MTAAYDHFEQKVYFTQYDGYLISRCNLDGSDIEVVLSNTEPKENCKFESNTQGCCKSGILYQTHFY